MLNLEPSELVVLAKSWIQPPELINAKDCSGYYDKAQRAYILLPDEERFSFTLDCSESNPLHNAAFIIKNRDEDTVASLIVNGEKHPAKQGIFRDVDGTYSLAVWIEKQSVDRIDFVVK